MSDLAKTIDDAFEARNDVTPATKGAVRDAVESALDLLDKGEKRVAEKQNGKWQVNQWLKKAVLLSFRLNDMGPISGGPGGANWWDKVPSKFDGWAKTVSAPRASARCPAPWCAAPPTSRRMSY